VDLPVSVVAKGAILVAAAERPQIPIQNTTFYSKEFCAGQKGARSVVGCFESAILSSRLQKLRFE